MIGEIDFCDQENDIERDPAIPTENITDLGTDGHSGRIAIIISLLSTYVQMTSLSTSSFEKQIFLDSSPSINLRSPPSPLFCTSPRPPSAQGWRPQRRRTCFKKCIPHYYFPNKHFRQFTSTRTAPSPASVPTPPRRRRAPCSTTARPGRPRPEPGRDRPRNRGDRRRTAPSEGWRSPDYLNSHVGIFSILGRPSVSPHQKHHVPACERAPYGHHPRATLPLHQQAGVAVARAGKVLE